MLNLGNLSCIEYLNLDTKFSSETFDVYCIKCTVEKVDSYFKGFFKYILKFSNYEIISF